jgi:lysyl-tRNA synthetase class 2
MSAWQPGATRDVLAARAALVRAVRAFFEARGVLEVDTPILSAHATVDRHIESIATADGGWLQTSPEFAMKRLLCAGSGPIWQIAPAFRRGEAGRHHNPEFRLLEWYRPGFTHLELMDEVEALVQALGVGIGGAFERLTYRDAFGRHAGLDPFVATVAELQARAQATGRAPTTVDADEASDRDFWLDLLMSHVVGPPLGAARPTFLFDFPASQCALARVRAGDPPVAERFELFWHGVELANGFHELADAVEQRRRFEADQAARRARGLRVPPYDAHLVAALETGLPPCAGVALGIDRLFMLRENLPDIAAAMAFDASRA